LGVASTVFMIFLINLAESEYHFFLYIGCSQR
jgi:hypothetical protein